MRELKQALLDIEFLQECNNSVNLALSVTRKQLAAAKAELAAMHKDNERHKRLATISRLCKNVQACRAEKAETKIKQMEDAIKFDFERFMEFQQRAEQAEAQCKRMEWALRSLLALCEHGADFRNGNVCQGVDEGSVMADRIIAEAKAALEEKP